MGKVTNFSEQSSLFISSNLALFYQTLDGEEIGQWNDAKRQWEVLPNEYKTDIRKGLRIAKKQLAPDLLVLPIKTPIVLDGSAATAKGVQ